MKNFTKIFFAVAALFAFACTTDTTEDLGVKLEGQTTLTLSLEESRTQLGSAVAGLYPVTWSEGDKISVNGVESSSITISENAAVATFTFNETLSYPYAIAYPAAAAGKVVFADQQPQSEGTFANGAAAMYGYKSAEGGLALNHLTGVLKIGVVGTGAINFVQISTIDRAPIAGEFAIDFATGELTPTSASKYQISAAFEESADGDAGLALSSEPQYLYFTVPAGQYDELYVTLYDADGGVMYATVKADDTKPLVAGKVREFSTSIPYAPNASVFVIRDKETLKAFAAEAATLEKDALFVADVDMTGETWTPIEGYAGTVHGNGYAIKGLTAPLFGTTSASIKGLHLRDVVLNSNNNTYYGAFACKAVAVEDTTPIFESCSVSGTFVVENTAYTPLTYTITDKRYSNNDAKASEMAYGGIVGLSCAANFINCVNDMTITVKQIAKMDNNLDVVPTIGGITGNAFYATVAGTKAYSSLTGCVNNADILYQDCSCNTETWLVFPAVGGVVGSLYHNTSVVKNTSTTFTNITDCTNYGDVTIQAVGAGQAQDTQGYPQTHAGGIIARGAYMTVLNCKNYGAITLDGHFKQTYSGGVCGTSWYSNIENSHNYGAVTVTEDSTFWGIMLAGITSINYSSGDYLFYITDCSNNAPISCLGSTAANATKGMYHYRIGGCEGFGRNIASNLTNNKEGVITCKGNIKMMNTNFKGCEIGGVDAYRTTSPWSNPMNYADINVDLNFSMLDGVTDTTTVIDDRALFIGGLAGYTTQTPGPSANHGNITVSGTYNCESLYVAGCGGYATVGDNTHNYGNITLDDNISVSAIINAADNSVSTCRTYVGGIGGGNDINDDARLNFENHGKIYIGGSHVTIWSGGLFAQCRAGINGGKNFGEIKIGIREAATLYVAGVVSQHVRYYYNETKKAITTGDTAKGYLQNCENHGEIIVETKGQISGSISIGGIAKQGQQDMINCVNHGDIKVSGGCLSTLYIGGLVLSNSAEPRKDCYNKGNILVDNFTIGGPNNTGSDLFIGGICYSGGSNTPYTNVHNEGDIEIGANVKVANCLRIGGFICNAETASKTNTLTNCSNSGDITVRATNSINAAGVTRIGGLIAQHQKGTLKLLGTIKNSGNINYAGLQKGAIGTSIGGIFGGNDDAGDMNGSCALIVNEGTVEFTGETVQKFYIGGIAPYCTKYAIPATVKLINTGDVKATGKCGAGMEADCAVVGMIRTIKAPIDGVQCFCNVYAPKYPAKTGILSGNARDAAATMYSNAKVGGTICKSQTTSEYEEADGTITTTVTDDIITLDATNFFSYIYGTDNWAGVENYDGCTVISSKEEIDYTVPVAPEA